MAQARTLAPSLPKVSRWSFGNNIPLKSNSGSLASALQNALCMRSSDFSPHPFFAVAIAYACGILLSQSCQLPLSFCLFISFVFTLCSFIGFAKGKPRVCVALVFFSFCMLGATLATIERSVGISADRVRRLCDDGRIGSDEPVEVTGVLTRPPERAPDGLHLDLRVESIVAKSIERRATGSVWLFAPTPDDAARQRYAELELRRGARLRVMTALSRTDSYRNPGVSTLSENLAQRDEDAVGLIKSYLLIERLDDQAVFAPLLLLDAWRASLLSETDRLFSRETAGVLQASLWGNRYYLSHLTAERFREGGTFHVLVISGLHISFLGGMVFAAAGLLTSRRLWRYCICVITLWGYALMVGGDVSVLRAAFMFTIVTLAPALARESDSLGALGAAAFALLIERPSTLFNPSFQLSFLSVLAIILLAWPLLTKMRGIGTWHPTHARPHPPRAPTWFVNFCQIIYWSEREWKKERKRLIYSYRPYGAHAWAASFERYKLQRPARYALMAVIVSLGVQVVMLPFLIVYFHRVSYVSILLNVWVEALMALLSAASLIALLTAQLSAHLAAPFVWLAEHTDWLVTHSVDPFMRWRLTSLRVPEYAGVSSIIYFLYYIPLTIIIIALGCWKPFELPPKLENTGRAVFFRGAVICVVVIAVIVVAHPLSARYERNKLEMSFLDVGQGDAALIVMPDGTTMLVDGGGRPAYGNESEEDDAEMYRPDERSIGEAVVAEYLWWRGLDHVDYLLATHADADHIQGLGDIARLFGVRAAFVARAPANNREYQRFAAALAANEVPIRLIGAGDALRFGDVVMNVFWPEKSSDEDAVWSNNNSIVFRLDYGEKRFLFTGDIERETEARLLATAPTQLHSDLIKVAHHGSKTSSIENFVGAAHPAFAIISVGRTSPFGHPSGEVVARWRNAGAQPLTTGQCGTITVRTDGHALHIETFKN